MTEDRFVGMGERGATRPWRVYRGRPLPLGVSQTRLGLNFAVFSRHATAMTLALFATGEHAPVAELPLAPGVHRTGDIWHLEVEGLTTDVRYAWRADRWPAPGDRFHRFDPDNLLLDPYARALSGGSDWGVRYTRHGEPAHRRGNRRRSLWVDDDFDWEGTLPPKIPLPDKVIYELHVRGFTVHPSAGVEHPGTYLGLIEKIPYLKELGVTTVELLPVYEFDELEIERSDPETGERLRNYWGYSPIAFFAPKAAYAVAGRNGRQVQEFKTLVRELHRAGIEVFLDVVFNHTGEHAGWPEDPVYSFRGLDNSIYYMLDPETGQPRNYSGCGNTLNCNHPVVRNLILDALRYWVAEMRVDGFRFDLASVLGRGQDGEVLANPPLLEQIAADPVLADTTLIAEAWDAAGLYQVGTFPAWGRWAEWNGRYRDEVRRFVAGEPGLTSRVATRLAGSADLYQSSGRAPSHSINFVTCHDGFTLADLVAYEEKRNEANGEENRDGSDLNFSWNCGVEGPTSDPEVLALRRRQVRNLLAILLLSQGTPMLLAGDEGGRTQRGNNNAYCQDNEISWLDWDLAARHPDLHRYVRLLIAFRRAHPALRRRRFLRGAGTAGSPRPDVSWHGKRPFAPDWGPAAHAFAMHLAGEHAPAPDCDLYLALNMGAEAAPLALPPPAPGQNWCRVLDTARESPDEIREEGMEEPVPFASTLTVAPRSVLLLRSR